MIARQKEWQQLRDAYDQKRSMFVVIYGRRRVGKTFLVNETFKDCFAFKHTGIANSNKAEQLMSFKTSLVKAGYEKKMKIKSWFDAFNALEDHINSLPKGKKVIFIDELPWLETPKSRFIPALEHFWNAFVSTRDDVLLIACGSATSWIIDNIINSHGGLYNRVSEEIYLRPFSLRECRELLKANNVVFSEKDVIRTYMVLGGIPFYWTLLKRGRSAAQNIDDLCFTRGGQLVNEFSRLFSSLYRNPEPYIAIMNALIKKKKGLERNEIAQAVKTSNGGKLSKYLKQLEQCDFIRKYSDFSKKSKNAIYQIIDPFVIFHNEFIKNHSVYDGPVWLNIQGRPEYNSWAGLAFERVCMLHVPQIKKALGINAVISTVQAWQQKPKPERHVKGAQIDMMIDRSDDVINVCEIKFSAGQYLISAKDEKSLTNKLEMFKAATQTKKALHLTFITTEGIAQNLHSGIVQSQVKAKDLFTD